MGYNPLFLSVKVTGIAYVTLLYFVFGLMIAKGFDTLYGTFDKNKYKSDSANESLFWLVLDIVSHIVFLAVVLYILRNIVERIPFPLEGVGGYKHRRLKELSSGPVMDVVSLFFQQNLTKKIQYFMKLVFPVKK
jgi:hypothetical protein